MLAGKAAKNNSQIRWAKFAAFSAVAVLPESSGQKSEFLIVQAELDKIIGVLFCGIMVVGRVAWVFLDYSGRC